MTCAFKEMCAFNWSAGWWALTLTLSRRAGEGICVASPSSAERERGFWCCHPLAFAGRGDICRVSWGRVGRPQGSSLRAFVTGDSSPRFRRCWTGTFPKPAAPDVARPSDRSAAVTRVDAASHRSVIYRARSVAAPPRRLAFDVCRIHARSPSPWTSVYRLHAGDDKGRPYGRVTDVWLVMRRHDSAPRLDLVHRCVSNGPGEPFILIANGWGASP